MEKRKQFVINLREQKADTAEYQWVADDDFFQMVGGMEVQRGLVETMLTVKHTAGAYDLAFRLKGHVVVSCDRCLGDMKQPIEAQCNIRAKLGDQYEDDGELVTVPREDGTLDVAWLLYELIALEIPMRHVHADGECEE